MPTIDQILDQNNVTQKELITHWHAFDYFSHTGSMTKLKKVSDEARNKIAKVYKILREKGIYPNKPNGETMTWIKTKTREISSREVERSTKENCKFGDCKDCLVMAFPDKMNCEIRTKEWHKGIQRILSVENRPKGEGRKMAEDIINYMNDDFMGGNHNR